MAGEGGKGSVEQQAAAAERLHWKRAVLQHLHADITAVTASAKAYCPKLPEDLYCG